jgi:hypothetical protein
MTNNFVDPADRCPEFIDADPRVNRYGVNGYPINKNFRLFLRSTTKAEMVDKIKANNP